MRDRRGRPTGSRLSRPKQAGLGSVRRRQHLAARNAPAIPRPGSELEASAWHGWRLCGDSIADGYGARASNDGRRRTAGRFRLAPRSASTDKGRCLLHLDSRQSSIAARFGAGATWSSRRSSPPGRTPRKRRGRVRDAARTVRAPEARVAGDAAAGPGVDRHARSLRASQACQRPARRTGGTLDARNTLVWPGESCADGLRHAHRPPRAGVSLARVAPAAPVVLYSL